MGRDLRPRLAKLANEVGQQMRRSQQKRATGKKLSQTQLSCRFGRKFPTQIQRVGAEGDSRGASKRNFKEY